MVEESAPRTAFVTGGGGGIGSAICQSLSATGVRVAVADLDFKRASDTAKSCEGFPVELDVMQPISLEKAASDVEAEIGPVDILVNCAGWERFMPFVDTDDEFMDRVLEINLAGPMRVTRRFLVPMISRGYGRIVNIASDAGRVGSSLEAIYSGAKGGLISFTKTVAREVARNGITANCVCPGPTDTPLMKEILGEGERADRVLGAIVKAVPMKRIGVPEDLGPAVVFLASDGAAFITGQTLSVSGGLTMA
jgi:2-hydroxycyclohexanecarboxyl-CoA dehydrogenase|tara:strand:- start:895 stop:1647 length:753 start_codon:yes stop_codon:yes gene_type:complete